LKYQSEDYFSVIEIKTGRKICDCGDEIDALMMVSYDPANRTITRNQFLMGQVVDIEIPKALPTSNISGPVPQKVEQEYLESMHPDTFKNESIFLPQSELEPFIP
jgi:hypothetical protein